MSGLPEMIDQVYAFMTQGSASGPEQQRVNAEKFRIYEAIHGMNIELRTRAFMTLFERGESEIVRGLETSRLGKLMGLDISRSVTPDL